MDVSIPFESHRSEMLKISDVARLFVSDFPSAIYELYKVTLNVYFKTENVIGYEVHRSIISW